MASPAKSAHNCRCPRRMRGHLNLLTDHGPRPKHSSERQADAGFCWVDDHAVVRFGVAQLLSQPKKRIWVGLWRGEDAAKVR